MKVAKEEQWERGKLLLDAIRRGAGLEVPGPLKTKVWDGPGIAVGVGAGASDGGCSPEGPRTATSHSWAGKSELRGRQRPPAQPVTDGHASENAAPHRARRESPALFHGYPTPRGYYLGRWVLRGLGT